MNMNFNLCVNWEVRQHSLDSKNCFRTSQFKCLNFSARRNLCHQFVMIFLLVRISAITLLMAIHLSNAQLETNGCNTNCTLETPKTPICATDDKGDTKIFPSDCIMRSENCINKTSKWPHFSITPPEPTGKWLCELLMKFDFLQNTSKLDRRPMDHVREHNECCRA